MQKIRIVFGLGSNKGEREKFLDDAIKLLESELQLTNLKKSAILENKALLLLNSPPEWDKNFLNLAVSADINCINFPPFEILKIIKNIEIELGRIDRERWGPREIDIDILAIDSLTINEEKLKIPHQELFNRDFVIKTFGEIEPELLEVLKNAERP